jgi:hypothetical protein
MTRITTAAPVVNTITVSITNITDVDITASYRGIYRSTSAVANVRRSLSH